MSSLEEKCVPSSLSDDIIHMQFASLLSSIHVHEHETCLGNGRMIILDDQAHQQMTSHFQLTFQCNVLPITGFVRHTAQKKEEVATRVQWAMIGQGSMHVQYQQLTNEVEEK